MELGSGEIMLILLAALLIYGGRLPQVAFALGRSLGELKKGLQETKDMVRTHVEAEAIPTPRGTARSIRELIDQAGTGRFEKPDRPPVKPDARADASTDEDPAPPPGGQGIDQQGFR